MEEIPQIRPVQEAEQVKRLLSLKSGRVSNCLWTLSEGMKAAASGRIYELQAQNGFAWVRRDPERNEFYFRTREELADTFFCELPAGQDYVAEIMSLCSTDPKHSAERKVLRGCGFELSECARMMTLSVEDPPCCSGKGIRHARRADFERIQRILRDSLDVLTDAIPLGEELLSHIEKGNIWVREDRETQTAAGFVLLDTEGRRTWIRHLTVAREQRRKGVASELLRFVLSDGVLRGGQGAGREFALWVKESNMAAARLYEGIGFRYSNRELGIWTKKALQRK